MEEENEVKMIRNIRFVAVIVKDTRKALEWYKDKLGFVVRVDTGGHHVEVSPPEARDGDPPMRDA